MINWKTFVKKWSWTSWGIALAFAWRDWGNPQGILSQVNCCPSWNLNWESVECKSRRACSVLAKKWFCYVCLCSLNFAVKMFLVDTCHTLGGQIFLYLFLRRKSGVSGISLNMTLVVAFVNVISLHTLNCVFWYEVNSQFIL